MNGTLVFVLMLVAIVMCAKIIETWLKQAKREPDINTDIESTLVRIDELEERIKVLERIVTESRFDLKKEIDSL